VYDVPVEAVELAGDINALESAIKLIKGTNETWLKSRWSIISAMQAALQVMREKMKNEFLAPSVKEEQRRMRQGFAKKRGHGRKRK
jgi:hypothetical protein